MAIPFARRVPLVWRQCAVGAILVACASSPDTPDATAIRERADRAHESLDYAAPKSERQAADGRPSNPMSVEKLQDPAGQPLAFSREAVAFGSKYMSDEQCYRLADREALRLALDERLPREVIYNWFNIESQAGERVRAAVQDMFMVLQQGFVTMKRVQEWSKSDEKGGKKCGTTVEGVIHPSQGGNPGLRIDTDPDAPGLNQAVYFDGDLMDLSFKVNRDACVYFLSVDEQGKATLAFPHRHSKPGDNRHSAGAVFKYPVEKLVPHGHAVRVVLPRDGTGQPTQPETVETMLVVAVEGICNLFDQADLSVKNHGPYRTFDLGEMEKVLAVLQQLPRERWTLRPFTYEIRQR